MGIRSAGCACVVQAGLGGRLRNRGPEERGQPDSDLSAPLRLGPRGTSADSGGQLQNGQAGLRFRSGSGQLHPDSEAGGAMKRVVAIGLALVWSAAAADEAPAWLKDLSAVALPQYAAKVTTVVMLNEER